MAVTIRSFISVHLSENVREQIARFQTGLKIPGTDIKWVRPENMHITLKFLGDIQPDQIDSIENVIRDVAGSVTPFNVWIRGAGCFPNEHHPRVLWLGIFTKTEIPGHMARDLNGRLAVLGFQTEKRKFKPHLTLGRVRTLKNIGQVVGRMRQEGFESDGFHVNQIHLMQSRLKPSGAEYSVLKSIDL